MRQLTRSHQNPVITFEYIKENKKSSRFLGLWHNTTFIYLPHINSLPINFNFNQLAFFILSYYYLIPNRLERLIHCNTNTSRLVNHQQKSFLFRGQVTSNVTLSCKKWQVWLAVAGNYLGKKVYDTIQDGRGVWDLR